MPPDPLVGAYQVYFAQYASYIAQHLINSLPFLMLLLLAKINLETQAG